MRRTLASSPPLAVLFAASGLIGLAGATAWLQALMRGAAGLGAICGHVSAAALHCPSCYAAAALAVVSAGMLGLAAEAALAPTPVPAPRRR